MSRVEFSRSLEVLDRLFALAFQEEATRGLVMVLGVVRRLVFEAREDRACLRHFILHAMNAGFLQMDLAGSVARLFRFIERFHRLFKVVLLEQRFAEVKSRQGPIRLPKVFDGVVKMAQEEGSNARFRC